RGHSGVAGGVGHVLVDPDGPPCRCGNRGCVEAIAGSRAILDRVAAAGLPATTLDKVARLARAGQPEAERVLAEAGRAVGTGIATVANLLGPEHVLITGEAVGTDYDVMEPHVREAFERHAFGSAARTALELRPLRFVDWARGAAACAVEDFVTRYGRSQPVTPGRLHCGVGRPVRPQVPLPSTSLAQYQHDSCPSGQPSGTSCQDSSRP